MMPRRSPAARRFAHRALALAAIVLPTIPPAAAAQAVVTTPPARVTVSRREVRVVFAPDTMRTWGWEAPRGPDYMARLRWEMWVDSTPDGIMSLGLLMQPAPGDGSARRFPSLDALVAEAPLGLCGSVAQGGGCVRLPAGASVEAGRVVLVLRDSARIARLFGMRPDSVLTWHLRHDVPYVPGSSRVRVEYVEPQLATPGMAMREETRLAMRRFRASRTTIDRAIRAVGSTRRASAVWLAVGDSVSLEVEESGIFEDLGILGATVLDSGWTVDDSTIVRLRRVPVDSTHPLWWPTTRLVGRRPGRTIVRVHGMHGAGDSMPSRRPPPRTTERAVIVTPPIARVELVTRPDTVRVGERVELRARAVDRAGGVHDDLPIELQVHSDRLAFRHQSPGPTGYAFDAPGLALLVARIGGRADSVRIVVVDAPTR
jgi:hypothetical protein